MSTTNPDVEPVRPAPIDGAGLVPVAASPPPPPAALPPGTPPLALPVLDSSELDEDAALAEAPGAERDRVPARDRLRRAPLYLGRLVLWGLLVVLLVRGVLTVVADVRATTAAPAAPVDAVDAVVDPATFAAQFAYEYLSLQPRDEDGRARRLAAFTGSADGAGWDGVGEQRVIAVVPGTVEADGERVVARVAARLDSGRWVHLAVPLAADGAGGLVVADTPAFVPAPPVADVRVQPTPTADRDLAEEILPTIESFFAAYGAGDVNELAYFTPVGRDIPGLDGAVELAAVEDLTVDVGDTRRGAQAAVRWRDPETGAGFTQIYRLTLVQDAGRWYVDAVGTQPAGAEDTR